jgi:hypothetical protein
MNFNQTHINERKEKVRKEGRKDIRKEGRAEGTKEKI